VKAKLCGVEHMALPMFDRATITLGIGPHFLVVCVVSIAAKQNSWMDQDATWYADRPRPRPHCVRWGPSSPKKGAQPPIFSPRLLWPNGRPSQLLLSTCFSVVTAVQTSESDVQYS